MQLLPFAEAGIEFPVVEAQFERHHTRGPGTGLLSDVLQFSVLSIVEAGLITCNKQLSAFVDFRLNY